MQVASTPRSQRSEKSKKKNKSKRSKGEAAEEEKRAHDIQIEQGRIFVGGREQKKDRVFDEAVRTPAGSLRRTANKSSPDPSWPCS